jgi:ketosteroid isomerase-like protein
MPAARFRICAFIRRPRLRAPFIVLVLSAFALAFCAAQQAGSNAPKGLKHENRREIDQMELAWRDAVLQSNIAAMDKLLADDYIAITPIGTLQSKDQTLENLRSGATHITAIEVSDRKVRFYGTTALVTSKADVTGTSAGRDFSGNFRYTRVYARDQQGAWKIVSFEANRIRGGHEEK